MDGFVDIHTHILPTIDDGARDMMEAIHLLYAAWNSGTRAVVLTPHYRGASRKISTSSIQAGFEQLTQCVQEEIPEIKLYLGRELHYEQDLSDKLRDGVVETLANTRYVLLEFSSASPRSQMALGVESLLYSGYIPIIAHVERYAACRDDKNLVDELINLGALIQINAGSVMGEHGWGIQRYCHKLLRQEKVHFVASDAHRMDWRLPMLDKCWNRVSRKYGQDYAEQLFCKNAKIILENREF